MSRLHLVVVADRHLLDSELLVAQLNVDGLVETAPAEKLPRMDLSRVSLVLLDSECDDDAFMAACTGADSVGLLYEADTPALRRRVGQPSVRLICPRNASVDELSQLVRAAVTGTTTCVLPRPRPLPTAPVLSPRESEVLRLMAQGLGNCEIALHLDISPHTVRTHVQSVLAKFDKGNRVAAVGAARLAGLLSR